MYLAFNFQELFLQNPQNFNFVRFWIWKAFISLSFDSLKLYHWKNKNKKATFFSLVVWKFGMQQNTCKSIDEYFLQIYKWIKGKLTNFHINIYQTITLASTGVLISFNLILVTSTTQIITIPLMNSMQLFSLPLKIHPNLSF